MVADNFCAIYVGVVVRKGCSLGYVNLHDYFYKDNHLIRKADTWNPRRLGLRMGVLWLPQTKSIRHGEGAQQELEIVVEKEMLRSMRNLRK